MIIIIEKLKEIDKYIKNKEKVINNLSATAKSLEKKSDKSKDNLIKLSLLEQVCRKWKKIKQTLTSDDIESKLEQQANDENFIKAQQLIEQVNSLLSLQNQLIPNLILTTKLLKNNITSQSKSVSMLVDQEVPCWENNSLNLVDIINKEEHQQTSTNGYKPTTLL